MSEMQLILEKLDRIELVMAALAEKQRVRDFYTTEEFALIVGRSEFTVREWCRHGRLAAQKRSSGRGKYNQWVVANEELLRYQRDGLLPVLPRSH